MNTEQAYEYRLDRIFSKGGLWKHRTFRTVLDPLSSEYAATSMGEKVEILRKMKAAGEELEYFVRDYKMQYFEKNRKDIANSADAGLAKVIEYLLENK